MENENDYLPCWQSIAAGPAGLSKNRTEKIRYADMLINLVTMPPGEGAQKTTDSKDNLEAIRKTERAT